MTTATAKQLTKSQYEQTAEYKALTDAQRNWVDIFVKTADAPRATREAYHTEDGSAYHSMLTRKTQSSPRITACLDRIFQLDDKARFIRDLEVDIRKSTGVARAELRRLYYQVAFGDAPAPTATAEADAVPDGRVPADCLGVYRNASGIVIGYRSADSVDVKLS
jgi:hypothetical protein